MVGVLLKNGTTIPYTPDADVAAGDIIALGDFAAIAIRDIPAGDLGELDSWDSPTYRIAKYADEAIDQGAPVYYDDGTNTATGTLGYSDGFLGYCANDGGAAAGDATVDVKLASP